MRALALADRPFHADSRALAAQHDLDVILCLGDLQPSWLETLEFVHLPKLGVRGNHDNEPYMEQFGIEDLHLRRVELDSGLSVCGFEGCVEHRPRLCEIALRNADLCQERGGHADRKLVTRRLCHLQRLA